MEEIKKAIRTLIWNAVLTYIQLFEDIFNYLKISANNWIYVKTAFHTLNKGKTARPDEITAEAMKAAQEVSMEVFHPLFEKIWNEEEVPSDWKEGFIVKLSKKGIPVS